MSFSLIQYNLIASILEQGPVCSSFYKSPSITINSLKNLSNSVSFSLTRSLVSMILLSDSASFSP